MPRTSIAPTLARLIAPILAGTIAFACYLFTISPSIGMLHDAIDGSELVVVASRLGIAHPPGSAIWLPLGWAALHALPFIAEPALRTNLLSAARASLITCGTARKGCGEYRWAP